MVGTLSVPPPMPIMLEKPPMANGSNCPPGPLGMASAICLPSSGNSILIATSRATTPNTADRTSPVTREAINTPAMAPRKMATPQRFN